MKLGTFFIAALLVLLPASLIHASSSFVIDNEFATKVATTLDDAEHALTAVDVEELNVSYKLGKDLEQARELALKATRQARSMLDNLEAGFTLSEAIYLNATLNGIPQMIDTLRRHTPETVKTRPLLQQLDEAEMGFVVVDSVVQDRMRRWAEEADQLIEVCRQQDPPPQ